MSQHMSDLHREVHARRQQLQHPPAASLQASPRCLGYTSEQCGSPRSPAEAGPQRRVSMPSMASRARTEPQLRMAADEQDCRYSPRVFGDLSDAKSVLSEHDYMSGSDVYRRYSPRSQSGSVSGCDVGRSSQEQRYSPRDIQLNQERRYPQAGVPTEFGPSTLCSPRDSYAASDAPCESAFRAQDHEHRYSPRSVGADAHDQEAGRAVPLASHVRRRASMPMDIGRDSSDSEPAAARDTPLVFIPAVRRNSAPSAEAPAESQSQAEDDMEDSTVWWVSGLRSRSNDDPDVSDPAVFGSGFKPPPRRFQRSPRVKPEPKPRTEAKPQSRPESRPEAKPQPRPEAKAPPRPEAKPQAKPEPAPKEPARSRFAPPPQAKPQEGKPFPQQQSRPWAEPAAQARARSPKASNEPPPRQQSKPEPRPEPKSQPKPEPKPQAKPTARPHASSNDARQGRYPHSGTHPRAGARSQSPPQGSRGFDGKAPGSPGFGQRPTASRGVKNNRDNPKAAAWDALKTEIGQLRRIPASDRKKRFMQLCLQWHPDKNPANQTFATRAFQLLQEQKAKLLNAP